jgi:hypothetical protein
MAIPDIVTTLIRDLGSIAAARNYAERIARQGGDLAPQYAQAAETLCAMLPVHEPTLLAELEAHYSMHRKTVHEQGEPCRCENWQEIRTYVGGN